MTALSTEGRLTPDSTVNWATPPYVSLPVHGKAGFYLIDGQEYGPDSVFSYGKRLKGNGYRRAKSYVIAESQRLRGALMCELGDHYLTEDTAEVHHRLRKDIHVGKALGIACHSHNAMHGDPTLSSMGAASQSETERENRAATDSDRGIPSSTETARSIQMTWRYRQKVFHPTTGLMKDAGKIYGLKAFADELEELTEKGKAQTYERYIRHDIAVGYFRKFDEDGVEKIERTLKPYPLSRLGMTPAEPTA